MLFPGRVQEQRYLRCRSSKAAEESPCGHRADKRASITGVPLHANPIPQDGAAGIGARRIDSDHTDLFLFPAVVARQTVDDGALAGSRRASNARQIGLTRARKEQPK